MPHASRCALCRGPARLPPAAAWLLAVRVSGGPSAAPLLPLDAPGRAVTLRDVRLATAPDGDARLWRAEARDTATVGVGAASSVGAWAVATFGPRVAALLGD